MGRRSIFPILAMLSGLLITGLTSQAAEQRLSVDVTKVSGVLRENTAKIHVVQVRAKDSSVVTGKLVSVGDEALRLIGSSGGERSIPYTQMSTIRLDLGARVGWRVTGGILGAFLGGVIGAFATIESSDAVHEAVGLGGLGGGAALGAIVAGRHRKWLIIEVN